ncbi:hypothetical protein IAR55_005242 [Kwoniella newhampshirensis]|uniref:F-box domain-containing protein n=1 Tax=Kwoniella newhampshirensis TaxID=1651941 RepID=A0AAW0YHF5_9TREE
MGDERYGLLPVARYLKKIVSHQSSETTDKSIVGAQVSDMSSLDSTSTTPTCLVLPMELVTRILVVLAQDDQLHTLAVCCQVSRAVYNIASPMVWQHLHIKSRTMEVKPLDRSKSVTGSERVDDELDSSQSRANQEVISEFGFDKIILTPQILLDDVQILTIHPHPSNQCLSTSETTSDFHLPNLHTMQLEVGSRWELHSPPYENPPTSCPITASIRPKRIVIRNATLSDIDLASMNLHPLLKAEVEFTLINSGKVRHHVNNDTSAGVSNDVDDIQFQKEVEKYIRSKLNWRGIQWGWKAAEREKKQKLIKCSGLEEWLDGAGRDWTDVLSETEVMHWLSG